MPDRMVHTTAFAVVTLGLLAGGCSRSQPRGNAALNLTLMREDTSVANPIDVTLRVDRIEAPQIIGSGWANFVVHNADRVAHSFAVRGNGMERLLPSTIQPGQTLTLRVELHPGNYELLCPDCSSELSAVTRQLVVAQW